ncbi:MAG: hypothetical protein R3272_05210 [Candidatus Promineifilaceae bacterium]|nr:hypothetical protein [Candidatus Promineifilaceae bacterium]
MVTAVVMVGRSQHKILGGGDDPVVWVQGARRAATRDLLDLLARQPGVERIILATPDLDGLADGPVDRVVQTAPGAIHTGEQLARIVAEEEIQRLLYLGGGAAPLLSEQTLTEVVAALTAAEQLVITNNQFASDWAGITPAALMAEWVERLPRDNMFGWVLSAEAGLPVESLEANAESRLDIDTPLDLMVLQLHSRTRPTLRRYLAGLPLDITALEQALALLARPASRVFIAGRVGPDVWEALNGVTRVWLRVLAEERGMVSSGRQARGEVTSLLAAHIGAVGMERFFDELGAWADVAFIDTRVLLAHYGLWPDAATRFASDLGRVEEVSEPWLRRFTDHARRSSIPVILGGHGLMAGDMYALCDILALRAQAL